MNTHEHINLLFLRVGDRAIFNPKSIMFAMKTISYSLAFTVLFFSLVSPVNSKESILAPVVLYANKLFTDPQKLFLPTDKIYSVISFNVENPGEHILTTDWHTPFNSIEHRNIYRFISTRTGQSFQLYSWLQLWKIGPLERTFTGQDFKQEFYGYWTVRFYLDGRLVGKNNFEIN